jgi:hypothetical protein
VSYASDAPETIDGLRDALLACPSWLACFPGSGAGQLALATAAIHYPDAAPGDLDDGTAADLLAIPPVAAIDPTPLAVLSIEAGSFEIAIAAILSMGVLEDLGQALRHELMSRYRVSPAGLVIAAEPSIARAGNPTGWAEAAGDRAAALTITGPYGLSL